MPALLLLAQCLAAGQGPAATVALERWLEEVRGQARLPGLAVVIVTAEGDASYVTLGADADGAEVTPRTVFAIGSLSKSFTALGVMLLVERGLLGLDQRAATVVPELDRRITVRQLLHQTSGLPGVEGFWLSSGTLAERVHSLESVALVSEPGAAFQYSIGDRFRTHGQVLVLV